MSSRRPRTLYEGKFLRVRKTGHWEFVERTKGNGVVVILPLTSKGTLVLLEQFRAAVGRPVIEFPAGLSGDKDTSESLLQAAQRELLEETGFASSDWKKLGTGPSSAGMTNEMITFYLAAGATRRQRAQPDHSEKIQVHQVPLAKLKKWLARKEKAGCLIDYKIQAALHLADVS